MKEPDQVDDATFMGDPNRWPRWPILPVKQRGTFKVGVMLEGDNGVAPIVYLTNMYAMDLTECEKMEFKTISELVDAGWRVD